MQRLKISCLSCKVVRIREIHRADKVVKGQVIMEYCAVCRIKRFHFILRVL